MTLSSPDLVDVTLAALMRGGLVLRDGPSQRRSPFELTVLDGESELRLRVYVRNVTHGGATRNPDEYRIQITDAEIEVSEGRLTLLLGYHESTGTFVSFDPLEHQTYGASPSVQVPRTELGQASALGVSSFERARVDGVESVVVVSSDFLADHVRALARLEPQGDGVTPEERQAILTGCGEEVTDLDGPPTADRERTLREVLEFVRDRRFSRAVRLAYGGRCAFCGINAGLIEGAHILPVAANGDDTVQNGLAACPTHHRAFDEHLLRVDESYRVSVDQVVLESRSGTEFDRETLLHGVGDRIRIPADGPQRPSPHLLRERLKLTESAGEP